MAQAIQMYLGTPQTQKMSVYDVSEGKRATVKQIIFTNTASTDAKITVAVNTIDIMKDYVVKANETKIIDMMIVLKENDRLWLSQEKENAINVMISGISESAVIPPANY